MKATFVFAGLSVAHGVTPIQKVLQMMQEMHDKGVAAKQEEEVKFSAFDQWCTNTLRTKQDEIDAGQTKIEELTAQIEKNGVEIRELTDRINELDEDVGRWKQDEEAATEVRDKENVDFKATVSDYTESIDALTGAIGVLKKQDHDTAQADMFLQVQRAKLVPDTAKKALAAFLQQPEELSVSAPEANAYEFQSGGVVDMLEKLLREFKDKKTELEQEEQKAMMAFNEIMGQLHNNIKAAENEISKKTTTRSETEEEKAEAEGEREKTKQEKGEDQAYRADTDGLCNRKTQDFNARQKLRGEELDAISKAMEIIGSKDVAGAGDKHLPALLQIRSAKPALAQLRSTSISPLQTKLADFLAERAKESNSALLAQVAQRAAADPFGKVKKMIKDLISKLVQEATEEAEHKGWCDTELTTNQQTRDKKTEEVSTLTSEIEDLTATIAQLTQDIADLTQALKELADDMASETAERSANKAKNEQTISDAKAAQQAVEDAMAVLKDFYAKAAEATAFTQQSPGEDAPETFEGEYTGMGTSGGNVVDFLEVILTDFSRLESETSTDEAMEADEFKTFMFESEKDQALKENDMKHKQEKKTQKESALHSAQEELKLAQEALNKANAYYEKLKPTCVDSGITYEERVKRREEEIVSLQEALKILAGTDLPTMG